MLDPRALVGASTNDDAAVYRVADDLAVVATVDYITPVVDDPYVWGMVAAANALSDIYAMGARPLFALNTVNFPRETLPLAILERVLEGGAAKATEAGAAILGGHSIDDAEPKYGMVVVGSVHPERLLRNAGARPGDLLLLTKPLGIGIITTAIKRQVAPPQAVASAVEVMTTLNRAAGEAMLAVPGVRAATDVTGFGLLGHLSEMLATGEVGVDITLDGIPVLEDAWELARQDIVPGGSRRNLAAVSEAMDWGERLSPLEQIVLADAQTSGGLLIAVEPAAAAALLAELHARGVGWARQIGVFTDRAGRIRVA